MNLKNIRDKDLVALKITLRYLLLGALWFLVTTFIDGTLGLHVHPYDYLLYMLVMGGVVYLLVNRSIHAFQRVRDVEITAERNIRELMNALPEFVCVRDATGKWLGANQFALNVFNIDAQNYMGKSFNEFISSDLQNANVFKEWCQAAASVWDARTPMTHEYRLMSMDGTSQIYNFLDVPILDDDGTPKAMVTIGRDITNYKRIEEKLAENEQQYKSLIDYNSDAILAFNLTGQCIDANPMAPKLTGYSHDELLRMTIVDVFKVDDPEEFANMLQLDVGVNGNCPEFVLQIQRKDNGIVDAHLKVVPMLLNETVVGYFGTLRDITAQKRAADELRAAKELLESFVNHTTDAINVLDLSGRVLLINDAFEEVFGWSSDEVIGQPLPCIPDELKQETERQQEWVAKGGNVSGIETIRIRKDGKRIYTSLTLSPIRDDSGRVVAYAGISRDISDNKRVERALRESEAKYRLIAEHTYALIGVIDSQGRITYASPSHVHVVGRYPDELEGQLAGDLVHPEDVERMRTAFRDCVSDGTIFQIDFRYLHKNGTWIHLETQGAPVLSGDGTLEKVVLISQDVTERKQTEDLLRQSDRLAVVGQLAAGVAHEIRNPLTALKGFVQLLQTQSEPNQRYLDIMNSELHRIEAIVNEFLVIAKPQVVNYKKTDVIPLLDSTITLLETQAIMSNVQILTEFERQIPSIWCERNQLKQVFINVLKNAIEAMPNGGYITITVSLHDDDTLHFRFTDTGVGIPPERITHLGAPFYTTKEKGTGLGLTVSYKIIREHHGKIDVQSDLGLGTTVDILLPVKGTLTDVSDEINSKDLLHGIL